MNIKPILFSTAMVQAHDAGRKSQTRRDSGLKLVNYNPDNWELLGMVKAANGWFSHFKAGYGYEFYFKSPYGGPGDVLWRRESSAIRGWVNTVPQFSYKADGTPCPVVTFGYDNEDYCKWTPSIHMPKQACRKWMRILELYPQRLQDISEQDAIAEGVEKLPNGRYKNYLAPKFDCVNSVWSFRTLIQSIHNEPGKPDVWEQNGWFWRIHFEDCPMPDNFLTN